MQRDKNFFSNPGLFVLLFILFFLHGITQTMQQFNMYNDVEITIDIPGNYLATRKTIIILYALRNGNTTEQTMGKKINSGDDWHYDIQDIKAQTAFIRNEMEKENFVVAYPENNFKSWPAWKTKHINYISEVQHSVDTIQNLFSSKQKVIYLNGHSGGGRFIFSYFDDIKEIPQNVERISFLDRDYGYDATYLTKLKTWLQQNKNAVLNVFAYNDSVALLNGKDLFQTQEERGIAAT